jgi:DNA invertase Pin-like site-specific DNA recombinase
MKSSNPGRSARVSEDSSCGKFDKKLPALGAKGPQTNEKKVGRPKRLDQESVAELKKLYLSRPYSVRELAEMFDVSRMTVWRAVTT